MSPNLRLKLEDLRRFRRTFEREMAAFLPGYQVSVGPFPEDWAQCTAQVFFRGQVAGLASIRLREDAEPAAEGLFEVWPRLVESALEKVAFRKALITDPETGLSNGQRLKARLVDLLRPPETGPRALGLWDNGESPALVLALSEIGGDRRPSRREMLDMASALKGIPGLICLARLGDRRLGAIFRAGPSEALARLDQARAAALALGPKGPYLSGYALFPQDLALDPAGPFLRPSDAAQALLDKAETALNFAYGRRHPAPVIGFGHLVSSYGQITQPLPQSRVVINLGSPMGAMPGQVFSVIGQGGEPKGEITVFETGEGYSLAHATESRAGRLAAGDRLSFSRIDWSGHPAASTVDCRKALEAETFRKSLARLAQGPLPLVLALARLDDHERLAAMAGEEELAGRLDLVARRAQGGTSAPPELCAGYGQGTLAMVWTGLSQETAREEALGLVRDLSGQAPLSMGLACWPNPVLTPEGLMKAAQDALLEAAMTGPETVCVFGPQTLNISGDHLFDEGDLRGAVVDYQKGLILDPGHLNLLNSLGVCQGRLGDHRAAIAVFDEVLGLSPDNLFAHFNKGCSLILSGRLEEAEQSLMRARETAPDNFEVLFHLGKTALELGHLDLALATLPRASELKGHRGGIHRLLGQIRLLTDDRKGALAAFKKAVKHNPDDADSLSSLGALFLESANDQEVALSLFSRSVELDPTNSLFRQRLGRLLYLMGDYKSAEHHLKSALDYGCRAEDVRQQLAELRERHAGLAPGLEDQAAAGLEE